MSRTLGLWLFLIPMVIVCLVLVLGRPLPPSRGSSSSEGDDDT